MHPFRPVALVAAALAGCTPEVHNHYNTYNYGDTDTDVDVDTDVETDVETDDTDADTDDTDPPYTSILPACDTVVPVEDLEIDLFGVDGNLFYFEITPPQRRVGDAQGCRGGGGGGPVYGWDPESAACPNFATNVRVVPKGATTCADTGKVEVDLVGQSSWRPWIEIPNLKLDIGEFQDLKFASGDKNLRFNNGQADSTIVREAVALRIWNAMGYPAPPTSFVKSQSNVWDTEVRPGAWTAHILVQTYKKAFFKVRLPEAVHVWEGAGDPFGGGWYDVECQWTDEDDCDNAALAAVVREVANAPFGEGFMEATAHVIDWPALHRNQCLSALTGTGDDWIHNSNNVVLVLREDGRVQYLPYSTDINGGHPWYPNTPYDGGATLAQRCAEDPTCRLEALTTCQDMVETFEALDVPTSVIDERCTALTEAGLARTPDAVVCESMKSFYAARPEALRAELADLISKIGQPGDTSDTGGPVVGPK